MEELLISVGVRTTVVDQCQYGMSDREGNPIKKPTKFATNSECLCEELHKRCHGRGGSCTRRAGGHHVVCNGQRAKDAAIYHFKLCRAILTGFRNQMIRDGKCEVGMIGLQYETEVCDIPLLHVGLTGGVYKVDNATGETFHDDLTGQPLDPVLVRAARRKEL